LVTMSLNPEGGEETQNRNGILSSNDRWTNWEFEKKRDFALNRGLLQRQGLVEERGFKGKCREWTGGCILTFLHWTELQSLGGGGIRCVGGNDHRGGTYVKEELGPIPT